jgi:hypothetical protein
MKGGKHASDLIRLRIGHHGRQIAMDAASFVVPAINMVYRGRVHCPEGFKDREEIRVQAGMAGVVETVLRLGARKLGSDYMSGSWPVPEVVV